MLWHPGLELTVCYTAEDSDVSQLQAGKLVRLGVDTPPLPGLRGTWVISKVTITHTMAGFEAAMTLAPVDADEARELEREQLDNDRLEEILGRDHGDPVDWAGLWDELAFLPQGRRQEALREAQRRHRDRLDAATRNARIDEIARAAREQAESQREQVQEQVQERIQELRREALGQQFRPKPRRIDLDE